MKYALISVSDKRNLAIISNFLLNNDYVILSTGGTFNTINSIIKDSYKDRVIQISDYTQFPEILEGRVKTLHPKIYSGILYEPTNNNHINDIDSLNNRNENFDYFKIDIVIVNLYPFQHVVNKNSNENSNENEIIENIDIGGVSLIRASAKNYKNVLTLVNPDIYDTFIFNYSDYNSNINLRRQLAYDAFSHVTEYDQNITQYFDNTIYYRKYKKIDNLKYGCNPYQTNSFISNINNNNLPLTILNGIPGYINILDALNSWGCVYESSSLFNQVASASFKHNAPAGVALGKSNLTNLEHVIYNIGNTISIEDISNSESGRAFIRARNCDPLSSFGDFIAISGIVDKTCALLIKREVTDGIIAKDYTDEALEILKTKKNGNFYIFKGNDINYDNIEFRELYGMAISQKPNDEIIDYSYLNNIVTNNSNLSIQSKNDLLLSLITLKYTPSNSISIAYNNCVIGIGAGQQNRVDCIKIAGNKSRNYLLRSHPKCIKLLQKFKSSVKRQDKVNAIIKYINNDFTEIEYNQWKQYFDFDDNINTMELLTDEDKLSYLKANFGLSLSSDAFFPFRDNIDYAARYNISNIIQPGGSIQDSNIIEACNTYNMTMITTNKRFFLH